jgi:hypothetical protein
MYIPRDRWIVLKDSFLALYKLRTGKLAMVVLVDNEFAVGLGLDEDQRLRIQNRNLDLALRFRDSQTTYYWYGELLRMLKLPAALEYSSPQR